jgi:O-antigen/teichoic acid export membrane protein
LPAGNQILLPAGFLSIIQSMFMDDHALNPAAKAGIAGGTLTTFIASITTADLLRTIVLTIVGAVVSFVVSLFLKWIIKRVHGQGKDG